MNTLKPLWLYLEIDHWKDIWSPGIYMCGNFKLFLLTFLFIFQFISLLHEYLFCSSPTPSPITFLIVHLTLRAVLPNLLRDTKWSSGEGTALLLRGCMFHPWVLFSGGSKGGARGAWVTHYFRPNRDPKGRKYFFWRPPPPPPNLRIWMTWTPPYLKIWIQHCYLPPKLLQYVVAVTLRSRGGAEAEGHKLEHILFLKVH